MIEAVLGASKARLGSSKAAEEDGKARLVLVVHEQLAAVAAVANDPAILQSRNDVSSGRIIQIFQTTNAS